MSNELTESVASITAKRPRKRVNLATAHTADGEVKSPTSVYDLLGISTHGYKTTNLTSYTATLKSMNLAELHNEAYARAVLGTDNRDVMIDRLEKKFIQETSKFKSASTSRDFTPEPVVPETERDLAIRTLSRGR